MGERQDSLGNLANNTSAADARKIAMLEAELERAVPKSKHMEILDALDTQKRLAEQLGAKLSKQSEILKRETRREETRDHGRIEELERKNSELKASLNSCEEKLSSAERRQNETQQQLGMA